MQRCLKTKTINNVKNDNPKPLPYSRDCANLARCEACPGQRRPQIRPISEQND